MFLIYQITNRVNGKIYIGAHEGTPDDGYMGSGKSIRAAIRKYGKENFTKTILAECENGESMYQRERELVTEEFVAREDTYNLCPGGYGGDHGGKVPMGNKNHLGWKHEYKARRPCSEERREKIRAAKVGCPGYHTQKHTPEAIERMRIARKLWWEKQRVRVLQARPN